MHICTVSIKSVYGSVDVSKNGAVEIIYSKGPCSVFQTLSFDAKLREYVHICICMPRMILMSSILYSAVLPCGLYP